MDTSTKIYGLVFLLLISLSSAAQLALENGPSTTSASAIINANRDSKAPQTDLLRTHTGEFIFGPATRVKFKIFEDESGLETTYFKIGDLPYMQSDGRQMIPHDVADGEHMMLYYSVDKQGNQEQVRTDFVYVDKRGPSVTSAFNKAPVSFNEGIPVFPSGTVLSVEVADEKVDVQKVMYQINEGPKVEGSSSFTIDLSAVEDEKVTIEVNAYDTFYNMTKEIIEFRISR
ncbi:MAG: hypothetical protein RLN88_14810 [Ekhidna sp.]|uniref:hypothetical protein n=1 Tax=Ekhidna sp. TaxID=2608089 RepID=UPI0032EB5129